MKKMYDIMIVDDDILIKDRLNQIIDWDKLDAQFVCYAQDSDTALELFLLHRPKIIITDIQIPIISGLELAKQILDIDSSVRFIIITGFADFSHVQTSIRLGAIDLISKPISPAEINTSIDKAIAYFEKLKRDYISSQNIELLLKENMPTFQIQYVSYLLEQKREYTTEETLAKLETLKINISNTAYNVALISPNIDALLVNEIDTVLTAIKNTVVQLLSEAGYKVYAYYDSNYLLICIISWDMQNGHENLEGVILNIHNKIDFYLNINMFSGFGIPTSDITTLHDTYHEAYIALHSQSVLDGGPVVNFKNVERFDAPLVLNNRKQILQAIFYFKNNSLEEMSNLIQTELSAIYSYQNNYISLAQQFVFDLTVALITESVSLGISIETISGQSDIFYKIFSCTDLEPLIKFILDFAKNISVELIKKRTKNKNMLITMAKEYIVENLKDSSLNLDMVSDKIGLSSIYFCKLFHKEEGVSFNTYLNNKRIDKAKKMLKNTNLKVFEVAMETGYKNPKYFNYVFKRITSVTPLDYRNSMDGD